MRIGATIIVLGLGILAVLGVVFAAAHRGDGMAAKPQRNVTVAYMSRNGGVAIVDQGVGDETTGAVDSMAPAAPQAAAPVSAAPVAATAARPQRHTVVLQQAGADLPPLLMQAAGLPAQPLPKPVAPPPKPLPAAFEVAVAEPPTQNVAPAKPAEVESVAEQPAPPVAVQKKRYKAAEKTIKRAKRKVWTGKPAKSRKVAQKNRKPARMAPRNVVALADDVTPAADQRQKPKSLWQRVKEFAMQGKMQSPY